MRGSTEETIDDGTAGSTGGRPTLVRVGRRRESHRLALVSAVATIFVATAIAKPWGGPTLPATAPSRPAASASPVAQADTTAETAPLLESGDYSVTVICEGSPGSQIMAVIPLPSGNLGQMSIRACAPASMGDQAWVYWSTPDSFDPSLPEPVSPAPSAPEPSGL